MGRAAEIPDCVGTLVVRGIGSLAWPGVADLTLVPALAGLRVVMQVAWGEPAGPFLGAIGLTNGLDLIVGP